MAGHGGRRPGAGRKRGSQNRITQEMREAFLPYVEQAIRDIAKLGNKAESEAVRFNSSREIVHQIIGRPRTADLLPDPQSHLPRIHRWARTDEEALPDPARRANTPSASRPAPNGPEQRESDTAQKRAEAKRQHRRKLLLAPPDDDFDRAAEEKKWKQIAALPEEARREQYEVEGRRNARRRREEKRRRVLARTS